MCLASSVVLTVTTFLPSRTAAVVVSACFGYVLSLDLISLVQKGVYLCGVHSKYLRRGRWLPMSVCTNSGGNRLLPLWTWKTVVWHALCLPAVGVVSGLLHSNRCSISDDSPDVLMYAIIGSMVLVLVCGELQGVYIGLDIWRNPLYRLVKKGDQSVCSSRKILSGLAAVRRCLLILGRSISC